jgi:hypothetical protein
MNNGSRPHTFHLRRILRMTNRQAVSRSFSRSKKLTTWCCHMMKVSLVEVWRGNTHWALQRTFVDSRIHTTRRLTMCSRFYTQLVKRVTGYCYGVESYKATHATETIYWFIVRVVLPIWVLIIPDLSTRVICIGCSRHLVAKRGELCEIYPWILPTGKLSLSIPLGFFNMQ